jgi:hypothetical protein
MAYDDVATTRPKAAMAIKRIIAFSYLHFHLGQLIVPRLPSSGLTQIKSTHCQSGPQRGPLDDMSRYDMNDAAIGIEATIAFKDAGNTQSHIQVLMLQDLMPRNIPV